MAAGGAGAGVGRQKTGYILMCKSSGVRFGGHQTQKTLSLKMYPVFLREERRGGWHATTTFHSKGTTSRARGQAPGACGRAAGSFSVLKLMVQLQHPFEKE